MKAIELKERLCRELVAQSGLEERREYLGMSSVGRCPREMYRRYVDGVADMSEQHHFRSWLGYLFQGGVERLFGEELVAREREIVAEFDERFRGHADLETAGGDLVEIKSVDWIGMEMVRQRGPKRAHRAQMQMYLRHGGYEKGFLVYVARDVPWKKWKGLPVWVYEMRVDEKEGQRLDGKARLVLAAVDAGSAPECVCGRCK